MPHKRAATVGAITLALSLAGITSSAAGAGDQGELTVSPGSVRPGERVTLSVVNPELMDQMDDDKKVTVRSDAFSGPVKLDSSGKVSWKGHATVRCDAKPGDHTLRFDEPVPPDEAESNGKVTVEKADKASKAACDDSTDTNDGLSTTAIGFIAGAATVVVAALAFVFVHRRRRRG
ncbi:hypothetical protein ACFWZ2_38885 [Streptomyces sp. NPDC059002]|uniref:hypothetical protein n=1 Tax=Streptomyces sp. NPDC059002 TaxID=3346690 RepID=UPI0036C2E035